jgi:predicted deacetylase
VVPEGFVAPAWLEGAHTARALAALEFAYHEDHLFVRDLRRGSSRFVPAIGFTGRSRLRALASIGWAELVKGLLHAPVDVRLALHPVDFEHEDLVRAVGGLVAAIAQSRRWTSYRELLEGR